MNSDYGASTRMGDVMAQPGLHPKLNKASWQQLGPHLVSQHQSTQVLLVAALASDLWMDSLWRFMHDPGRPAACWPGLRVRPKALAATGLKALAVRNDGAVRLFSIVFPM